MSKKEYFVTFKVDNIGLLDENEAKEKFIKGQIHEFGHLFKDETKIELIKVSDEKIKEEWFFNSLILLAQKQAFKMFLKENMKYFEMTIAIISDSRFLGYVVSLGNSDELILEANSNYNSIQPFINGIVENYKRTKRLTKIGEKETGYCGYIPAELIAFFIKEGIICKGNEKVKTAVLHEGRLPEIDTIYIDLEVADGSLSANTNEKLKKVLESF